MLTTKYNYIYKTTNLINGKVYVGKHCSNIEPEKDKYIGSGKLIKAAFKKYGKQNFQNEILEFCLPCRYNMIDRERFWIKELNTKNPNGYNLTEGGEGLFNYKFSEEHKKKIGLKSAGRKAPQYTCPYCGLNGGGTSMKRWHFENCTLSPTFDPESRKQGERSAEYRANLSKALMGHGASEETRKKIGDRNRGKFVSEQARVNIANAHRGKKYTPKSQQGRENISKAKKGITPNFSQETLDKFSKTFSLGNNPKAHKVVNKKTGDVFGCAVEAFNISKCVNSINTFRNMLNGHRKNTTDFVYIEDYENINNN